MRPSAARGSVLTLDHLSEDDERPSYKLRTPAKLLEKPVLDIMQQHELDVSRKNRVVSSKGLSAHSPQATSPGIGAWAESPKPQNERAGSERIPGAPLPIKFGSNLVSESSDHLPKR